jgi:hypothetical protein
MQGDGGEGIHDNRKQTNKYGWTGQRKENTNTIQRKYRKKHARSNATLTAS